MMVEEESNGSVDQPNSCRQLRARCRNKKFSEDTWLVSKDEEDIGSRRAYFVSYNLPDKLKNAKYSGHGYVKEVNGYNFTVEYLDRNGFGWPVSIRNKHSIGMKVPDSGFGVNEVRKYVGSDRVIDVIDVHTQKDVQMSMKEYQKYFEKRDKDKLYNVISLEFSHTRLEEHVVQPGIVRKLDWVELYWPKSLKSRQSDSTNIMKNMMYPKVQKYCLMSVKGCYTDFHVDLGGTSVWYHILKGMKVFWLIRPTDENLALYHNWLLLDKRLDNGRYTFLGDVVDRCERVVLKPGQTFFIPSGWLHAVYTPKDSLVFGGNFLHSYSIDMQVKISRLEDDTRVTKKFRYPYFTEMHWYALDGMVRRLIRALDSNAADCLRPDEMADVDLWMGDVENASQNSGVDLKRHTQALKTVRLLRGVKAILDYLNYLSDSRKDVPEQFGDHVSLLKDAQFIYENYKSILDKRSGAGCTGLYKEIVSKFHGDGCSIVDSGVKKFKRKFSDNNHGKHDRKNSVIKKYKTLMVASGAVFGKQVYRRRRTRCRACEACCKDDCGSCVYCKDMIKYGGNGRAKQSCIMRQCLQPVLPSNSVCVVCNVGCPPAAEDESKAEHERACAGLHANTASIIETVTNAVNGSAPGDDHLLMECAICYEIVHPRCLFDSASGCDNYDVANNINDDLPNSWKCPKCYAKKRSDQEFFNKQRFFKARSKVVSHAKPDPTRRSDDE